MKLTVSEAFYSLQGEGMTTGYPALFIRFSDCNLHCVWCDSQEVMSKTKEIDLSDLIGRKYFDRVIFTGGEPMLYQDEIKAAIKFINSSFPNRDFFYEIETNGTILPGQYFRDKFIQFNISPKLANSGMSPSRRKAVENIIELTKEPLMSVKFVISAESDIEEIKEEFSEIFQKHKYLIYLMPAGASRKELETTAPMVAELCIKLGLKFSNRQHIILWDTKKGV